jgi:hypothetical protein
MSKERFALSTISPPSPEEEGEYESTTNRPPSCSKIFSMAERLYDVVWTMRERGLDPAACEEIETLASSILAASSLQDPADHRAQKLKEVLQYLERRIGSMLNAGAQAGPMPPEGLIPPIQPAAAAAPTEPLLRWQDQCRGPRQMIRSRRSRRRPTRSGLPFSPDGGYLLQL